jgi:hypothetical protein
MNTEKQRIAIAEACGWKMSIERIEHNCGYQWTETRKFWTSPSGKRGALPDYPTDFNAMHDAEKVLSPANWSKYLSWLGYCGENNTGEVYGCVTATAAQRAEAFLRTLNIWKE